MGPESRKRRVSEGRLGGEGHEGRVTVLLPQVCHGREEPPRMPRGELVWRALQTPSF